ncbi:MAG: ABC transporter permease [Actinomycetota bacterium]|nr:ABC transporter permease [Actinomycetota bacterium]MDH5223667.1 ABC transporter permease [Actinomycetota bacterium]MDH5313326.1 ABC transporter permease [Actinomycetota bacterium]
MNTRKVIAIAGVNLRRLTRDKVGAFFVFVFPLLIILAIGAAFGSGFTPQVGIVASGSGPLADDLRARLEATEGIEVRPYVDIGALRTAVERGSVEAGLVIPATYDERIGEGETVAVTAIVGPTASQELQLTLDAAVDAQNVRIRAARFAASEGVVGNFDDGLVRVDALAGSFPQIDVTSRTAGNAVLGTFETGAAQELILFMFLTSLSASSMLIETRRFGVSTRMLASPTPMRAILVGEALGRYAIAIVQGLLIVIGTVLLFQVEWGNAVTTALVVLLFALAATGAAMVMGSVLQNASQAGAMGVFLGLVLAAIGGCMVPLEIFPPVMYRIAHLFPHAWAIEALTDSISTDAGPSQVASDLWVLAAYGAVLLSVATVLLRRTLTVRG